MQYNPKDTLGKAFVLAGNVDEWRGWCARHRIDPKDTFYVAGIATLRGVIHRTLVRTGTWHQRPDATDILDYVKEGNRAWDVRDEQPPGRFRAVVQQPRDLFEILAERSK